MKNWREPKKRVYDEKLKRNRSELNRLNRLDSTEKLNEEEKKARKKKKESIEKEQAQKNYGEDL